MWLCTIQAPFVKLYFLARVYDASIDPRRVRDRTSRDTRPEKALLTALPFGGKEGFHPLRVSSCRAREIEWRNDRGCTWRSIMYTCVLSRLYVKRKDKYREREREQKGRTTEMARHMREGGKKGRRGVYSGSGVRRLEVHSRQECND